MLASYNGVNMRLNIVRGDTAILLQKTTRRLENLRGDGGQVNSRVGFGSSGFCGGGGDLMFLAGLLFRHFGGFKILSPPS